MKKHYALLIILVLALGLIFVGCMEINSSNTLNRSDDITIDLTVLTNDELEMYELFCENYDEDNLINANPESIMKMYITSAIKEDYET